MRFHGMSWSEGVLGFYKPVYGKLKIQVVHMITQLWMTKVQRAWNVIAINKMWCWAGASSFLRTEVTLDTWHTCTWHSQMSRYLLWGKLNYKKNLPYKEWLTVLIALQDTKAELAEHASDLETLQTLSKELSEISPDGNKSQIQSKMDNLSNVFSTFKDTVKEK